MLSPGPGTWRVLATTRRGVLIFPWLRWQRDFPPHKYLVRDRAPTHTLGVSCIWGILRDVHTYSKALYHLHLRFCCAFVHSLNHILYIYMYVCMYVIYLEYAIYNEAYMKIMVCYKVEGWRIDAFELWCWRRLLRVTWTARRSNQTILKTIFSPEYSLEGLMLKLSLQYFGHLMRRADSLEKTLMLGKIEGRRRRDNGEWDGWMASPSQWTWVWASCGRWWRTGKSGRLHPRGCIQGHNWVTEQQPHNTVCNKLYSIM